MNGPLRVTQPTDIALDHLEPQIGSPTWEQYLIDPLDN